MNALPPSFIDPVHNSQQAFRALLKALSRPGTLVELPFPPAPPLPFGGPAAAAALTLFDIGSPVWLDGCFDTPGTCRYLHYHTGAPIVAEPSAAAFAIIGEPAHMPRLNVFCAGEAAYPDRSATLIIQLPSLTGGPEVTLFGPGIETAVATSPSALPAWFWSEWNANAERYPLGIDLFLADRGKIMGLPRTTKVHI